MCVIICGGPARPSLEQLLACEQRNPDGGGLAWATPSGVSFRKGLTARQIHKLLTGLPEETPFVAHFRYTTIGETLPGLCHPFVAGKASLAVSQDGVERALFHNGTWSRWRSVLRATPGRKPQGAMSDTRAIAWMLGHIGEPILDEIDCKFAVIDEQTIRVYPSTLHGWHAVDGCLFSNLRWQSRLSAPPSLPKRKKKAAKKKATKKTKTKASASRKATTEPQPDAPRQLFQR